MVCFHSELVKMSEDTWVPWVGLSHSLTIQHSQAKRLKTGNLVPSTNCPHSIYVQQSQSDYSMQYKSVLLPDAHVFLRIVST